MAEWLVKYDALCRTSSMKWTGEEQMGHQLLYAYHTMAGIMADTCLSPGDEARFDAHTEHFALLVRQLVDLWNLSARVHPLRVKPARQPLGGFNMSGSIVDLGWIPLLYYVALKCRVHRIRIQAIRFLELGGHREGMWDSKMAGCVARKVVEVEEVGFYGSEPMSADHFPLASYPREEDLLLPLIPVSNRVSDVEVILTGAPVYCIKMSCRKKQDGKYCGVLGYEYSLSRQSWNRKVDNEQ
jgi:hypothetical protein